MSTVQEAPPAVAWRPAAALLAVGTFAVGTDAFVIAGLLPQVARSLHVSIGAAGQLVTVFAIAYAIFAPLLGALTGAWPRRTLLIAALCVFACGNVLTAVSPTFGLVLASRVIAAAGAAVLTATSTASAAALAGERDRGRAIATVIIGVTSSLALGAPLGAAVGGLASWRATLWGVAALGLVAATALALWLPQIPHRPTAGLRERLSPLQDARLRRMFARTLIVFIGVYLPYTYLSQIYEPVAHGEGWKLALLMSLFGISGTVGNIVAGALADRRGPRTVVIGAALALTASFALVPLARETLATTVVAVIVTGWLSFSITAPQQQELIAARPDAQPLVTALFQASGYLAVSCSGVVGAVGLDLLGPGLLPLLAAALTLAAALFALATPPGSA